MNAKAVTQIMDRLSSIEGVIKDTIVGKDQPAQPITGMPSILPDGSEPENYQAPISGAMVISGNGQGGLMAIPGDIAQVIKQREEAAYNRGVTYGVAAMGLIGACILLKMLR